LKEYLPIESPGFRTIDAHVGDRVRIKINGSTREVTIKGILKSKADEVDLRTFFVDKQLRGMIGRDDFNVDEISMVLHDPSQSVRVKQALLSAGVGDYAKVQTSDDALPKFVEDMKTTFAILGNVIGSIGLVVASITIFIVIFINAITRRTFIGILKGIGVDHQAIEWSYVFQSTFYALIGSTIGMILVYVFLVPFFYAHPINFPFSDGILVAEPIPTFIKGMILVFITMIAGYVPARMIVRRNTLNAILGR
jgi:ABC-type lipoprotein release transport system permease subunit